MEGDTAPRPPATEFGTGAVITQYHARIVIYEITEQELDLFASGARMLHASLAGVCWGVAVPTVVALLLAWPVGILVAVLSAALAIAATGMGSYFTWQAISEYRTHAHRLREFKRRSS